MPRNMSFFYTQEQMRNKTKTVTRRLGWDFLKPGDIVNAVEKGQGLKKGEKVKKIGRIRILKTHWESLRNINYDDIVREGFPLLNHDGFIEMFCKTNKCEYDTFVNRIEFEPLY